MASPAEVVAAQFANATAYANTAKTELTSFTQALDAAIYTPPTLSVTWNSLTAPALPSLPSTPTLPTIVFSGPAEPAELILAEPTITIDAFDEIAPTVTMPTAPTLNYGTAPSIPNVAAISLPTAPTLTTPNAPSYLALNTPSFAGIDLHADYLTRLEDIPTLDLVAPTPYSYSPGAEYASGLLSALKAKLLERTNGGSGLTPAVEQAIWDRSRNRETKIALANEAEVMRTSEAMGFQLPTGVLAAQLRGAQQDYFDKLSGFSRDVAIKQADLEQENLKQTIAQGVDLEGRLIGYSYQLEQLSFETAKATSDNAIQVYNAQVETFKSLLSAYQVYAQAYDTVIKSELAKVEVYKAQLQGEQTKAEINKTLVEQYKATIEVGMAQVEIYRAQVGATNTLVQLEQTKISAAGEQIRAYVAQINGETAKVEAYKAGVQAETAKVEVYRIKAGAYSSVVGAQADRARLELGRYTAQYQAKAAEYDGYRARVAAESSRIDALGRQSNALLDGYRAVTTTIQTQANLNAQLFETEIKQYEASQQLALSAGKINTDNIISANNARLDAAKVGAQVYAQLTSSAYGMINASAGVSASGGTSVSYSYSNDTTGPAPTVTVV